MKSFYSWYKKHITQAIFTGLVLGILTGLFLAGRYAPVLTVTSLIGGIYMNALNMMIFPMVFCSIVIGIFSQYHRTCQPRRSYHPASDPSWKRCFF